jgi:indole-3-glycerol phosphate synthase
MTTALDKIIEYKRDEVAALKRETRFSDLDAKARSAGSPRGFAKALSAVADTDQNALICELKRKSPSAGRDPAWRRSGRRSRGSTRPVAQRACRC